MDMLLTVLLILVVFAVIAGAAGADSGECANSGEWERRQHWQGFGGDGHYSA
jgi:hypothetical protein